ncbi:hypothetical protein YM18_1717 [Geobacter sulfurreducens]|nr:hypothetical protein YM18_1717 [Geobacter sulfurreducens]
MRHQLLLHVIRQRSGNPHLLDETAVAYVIAQKAACVFESSNILKMSDIEPDFTDDFQPHQVKITEIMTCMVQKANRETILEGNFA